MEQLYKPAEFGKLIGRSVKTLQRWDRLGLLKAYRAPTNRRYYTHTQYLAYRAREHQAGGQTDATRPQNPDHAQ